MDRYILILGAGLMQRPAIEAVKALGYKALVVDANDKALCVKEADRFEKIDLKNKESLASLALSLKNSLCAVFTAGTDFSASVAYVAEKCGLKSHSYKAALCASDKVIMRTCFARDNVSSPCFREVSDKDDINLIQIDSYPKVIKPVDNMGARGCRMIRSEEEKFFSIKDAIDNSRSGRAILEDYMEGSEFSIDALVCDGNITITGFADRHIYYPPYFIEMGHTMPSCIDQTKKYELINCFADAIHALGLSHGAAKADIKYTSKGPMIGEVAGRLSGGYMSGWTYPYASDFDLTKNALEISLGLESEELISRRKKLNINNSFFDIYEVECTKTSAERAWISIPGTIKEIIGLDEAGRIENIKDVLPRSCAGDSVIFPVNNVSKCGNIIALADSYTLASVSAETAVSKIVLRLDPLDKSTEDFIMKSLGDHRCDFPPCAYDLSANDLDDLLIKSDTDFINAVPESVKPYLDLSKDYNHRTLRESLSIIKSLYPNHPDVMAKDFWNYLLRGGVQGALYLLDSLKIKADHDER